MRTMQLVDAFVYELNEPAIISALTILAESGKHRLLADDASLRGQETVAALAFEKIQEAAADAKKGDFKRGKFKRFQHNKVLIRKVNGVPVKVLAGSTSFSVTGLYANANHVLVLSDEQIAKQYEEAFDTAFSGNLSASYFYESEIFMKEFPVFQSDMPSVVLSFAPRQNSMTSLKRLLDTIKSADSSVIFAVMDLNGESEVLKALSQVHSDRNVFSYGISDSVNAEDDTINGTTAFTPSSKGGELVYSKANPEEFPKSLSREREVGGPKAPVVHHKFVVVDFNGANPVVSRGSSNLSEGCSGQMGKRTGLRDDWQGANLLHVEKAPLRRPGQAVAARSDTARTPAATPSPH